MSIAPGKIKCAVIGCGHIGKRHAEMISNFSGAELVALCDIKAPELLGIEQYEVPFFPSMFNLLRSDIEMDVVHICTPNGLHAQQALDVLMNGQHVVIEKPMALKRSDCEKIISLAEKKNKKVFCVMQNRFSPPSAWIKEVVENKLLGEIYFVQVNCFWNRDERYYTKETWHGTYDLDGGTLFTQFSHFVDTMLWLFGNITNIKGHFADFAHAGLTDFEDTGSVIFEFENGAIGNLNYSTAVAEKNFESSITIIAEKGTVKIGGQYMDKVEHCSIRDYKMPKLATTNPANDYGPYKGSAANHHLIIQNVIDALQHDAPVATTAQEGMMVVDVIERIYAQRPDQILKQD